MGIFGYIQGKKDQFKNRVNDLQRSRLENENVRLEKERQEKAKLNAVVEKNAALKSDITKYDQYKAKVAPSPLQRISQGYKAAQAKQNKQPIKPSPFTMGTKNVFSGEGKKK
jgi:hypothetical protein